MPCDGLRLSLFAIDDRGRRFTGIGAGYTDKANDREREFSFSFWDIPPNAKSLDLTFAIHKTRYADRPDHFKTSRRALNKGRPA
jgi:hypothetical protein